MKNVEFRDMGDIFSCEKLKIVACDGKGTPFTFEALLAYCLLLLFLRFTLTCTNNTHLKCQLSECFG